MLKRTIISTLAASALVFAFASCASTGAAAPAKEAEPAAPEAPAAPASELAENEAAAWNFAKKPADGIITTDYKTFMGDVEIPAVTGSEGATLTILAGAEAKYLSEDGETFIATNNKGSLTAADVTEAKCHLALTLANPGTITIDVSGNGDGQPSRLVAITNEAGDTVLAVADNLSKQPHGTVVLENAAAGTYGIAVSGARLHKLTVSK